MSLLFSSGNVLLVGQSVPSSHEPTMSSRWRLKPTRSHLTFRWSVTVLWSRLHTSNSARSGRGWRKSPRCWSQIGYVGLPPQSHCWSWGEQHLPPSWPPPTTDMEFNQWQSRDHQRNLSFPFPWGEVWGLWTWPVSVCWGPLPWVAEVDHSPVLEVDLERNRPDPSLEISGGTKHYQKCL